MLTALVFGTSALAAGAAGSDGAGAMSSLETDIDPWRCKLPGAAPRSAKLNADFSSAGVVRMRVRLHENPGALVRVLFFLQNAEGWYYQTATTEPLRARRWHELEWSVSGDSGDLQPAGHFRPWDGRAARSVRLAGLKIFANRPCEVELSIEDVAVTTPKEKPAARAAALRLLDCRFPPKSARVGERLEIGFRLEPQPGDVFSPEAPVKAVFITPSGGRQSSSAFYYQGYRVTGPGSARRLVPSGRARWLIRYMPAEPGRYRYRLIAGAEELGSGWFEAARSSLHQGNASGPPRSLFEGTAVRPEDFVVDLSRSYGQAGKELIPKSRAAVSTGGGWKLGRVEAPGRGWWVPLEWSPEWGRWTRGEYQMRLAWLFDRRLEAAEGRNEAMPFALVHDAVFSAEGKFRWAMNPLNEVNGGPLKSPGDFFASGPALERFKRMAAYVSARWGYSPALSEWCLGVRLPARGVAEWHGKVRGLLAEADPFGKRIVSLNPLATGFAKRGRLGTFERGNVWRVDASHTRAARVSLSSKVASEGKRSLMISGSFPTEHVWIRRELDENVFDYPLMSFDVLVPENGPKDLRVQVYLRDGGLLWYEVMTPTMLRRGDWTKVLVPLGGDAEMRPSGHRRPWGDYSRTRVREVGLRFYCAERYSGPFYLDNVVVLGAQIGGEHPDPCRVVMASAPLEEVETHDLYEISFRLSRGYSNPFDPDVVDVSAEVRRPDGKLDVLPAFWYQAYERGLADQMTTDGRCKSEVLEPVGAPVWKVRYAPTIAGEHSVELVVREPDGEVARKRTPGFRAVGSTRKGYVRVAADGRHLELTTGEFFYPVGMNLRSPSDSRDVNRDPKTRRDVLLAGHRGTFQYDDYYDKMERSSINFARIWMCPWWCGLEWYRKWPGYHGRGVYNLENAWRMDYLLEEARRRGIYVQLCTMNHGQVSPAIDHEWEYNPLNYYDVDAYAQTKKDKDIQVARGDRTRPRGLVKTATEFFTNKLAKLSHKKKLRYTVARWGYSPAVMAWVLSSEVEFTEEYWRRHYNGDNYSPVVASWHLDMAKYVKSIDPWAHVVTTHFSHPIRGRATQRLAEMEFLQSNAYSSFVWFGGGGTDWASAEHRRQIFTKQGKLDQLKRVRFPVGAPAAMERYFYRYMRDFMSPMGKSTLSIERPVLIGEWGGHWMKNSMDVLDAELHTGLWATMATPMAGATGYWWWPHVHFRDRYSHYAALSKFMKGEDRRGLKLGPAKAALSAGGSASLRTIGVKTREFADVYVYHAAAIRTLKGIPAVAGVKLGLRGLSAGPYTVEIWDTFKGAPVSKRTVTATAAGLEFDLPVVKTDLAVKIRPDRGRGSRRAPARTGR